MQVQEDLLEVSKDHTNCMIMKGKRTKRQRAPSPLRLAMPSNNSITSSSTNNSIDSATTTTSPTITTTIDQLREEDQDMANCLILLAQGRRHVAAPSQLLYNNDHNNDDLTRLYVYECKTCNRCFPSFQALGGHRASHKKPKQYGTEAVTTYINIQEKNDHYYDSTTSTTLSLKIPNWSNSNNLCSTNPISTTTKTKVHECSICGAEFSSGQALGGHMRRHRTLVNGGNVGVVGSSHEFQEAKKPLKLDLNLPAPEDDHRESKFSFQKREKVIVFSTSHQEPICIQY